MNHNERMLRSALIYAGDFGWHIFPCAYGKKFPAIPGRGGFKHATSDLATIERWWGREYRGAGIGVWPRPSGLIILDVDRKKPEEDGLEVLRALEAELGSLPETPMQVTPGGGLHLVFQAPGIELDKHPFDCPWLELFTDNHVCLTPTVIDKAGTMKPYAWDSGAHLRDTDIAKLPDAWIARAQETPCRRAVDVGDAEYACTIEESFAWALFDSVNETPRAYDKTLAWVNCPWWDKHGVHDGVRKGCGQDSSSVIIAPLFDGHPGAFKCQHAPCFGKSIIDVAELFDDGSLAALAWKKKAHVRSLAFLGRRKKGW